MTSTGGPDGTTQGDIPGTTAAPPLPGQFDMDPAVAKKVGEIIQLTLDLSIGLYMPILLLGLIGNGLSFHILKKKIQTSSTHIYLSTLAIMDSLFLLLSIALIYIPKEASSWLLVTVSIERLLVVYLPTKVKDICNVRRAKVIIATIIVALCVINWNLFGGYRTVRTPLPGETDACVGWTPTLDFYNRVIFGWIQNIMYTYVPSVLLIIINAAIITRFIMAAQKNKVAATNQDGGFSNRTMAKHSVRMTRVGLTLSMTFLLLTLPFAGTNLWTRYLRYSMRSDPVGYYTKWMASRLLSVLYHLNHAINMVLYCLTNSRFRDELLDLVKCRGRKKKRGDEKVTSTTRTASSKTPTG